VKQSSCGIVVVERRSQRCLHTFRGDRKILFAFHSTSERRNEHNEVAVAVFRYPATLSVASVGSFGIILLVLIIKIT
jgi:nitrate reductase NapE component